MSLISDYDVVVIGAGAAGLAASAELMAKGKSVICLEAMDRIGGRCYTDHSIFGLPCDIGAHWLHSYSGNKIAQYGLKIGNEFDVYKLKENVLVYDENKKTDGSRLYSVINQIKSLKDKYSKSNSNSQIIDVPFLDLIPDEVKNNEGYLGHELIKTNEKNMFISYWKDLESIELWKNNKLHIKAKAMGPVWYDSYKIQISKLINNYNLE